MISQGWGFIFLKMLKEDMGKVGWVLIVFKTLKQGMSGILICLKC